MPALPIPAHAVIDDSILNADGPWAFVHSLAVHLPDGYVPPMDVDPDDEPGFRATWTDIFTSGEGDHMLVVNMATATIELLPDQLGVMTGELVEEWVRLTIRLQGPDHTPEGDARCR